MKILKHVHIHDTDESAVVQILVDSDLKPYREMCMVKSIIDHEIEKYLRNLKNENNI